MKPATHHLLTLCTAVAATLCALLLPVLIEDGPMLAPPLHADPQATLSLLTTLHRGA